MKEKREDGVTRSAWLDFDLADWIDSEARKRKWTRSKFIAEALKTVKERGEEIE